MEIRSTGCRDHARLRRANGPGYAEPSMTDITRQAIGVSNNLTSRPAPCRTSHRAEASRRQQFPAVSRETVLIEHHRLNRQGLAPVTMKSTCRSACCRCPLCGRCTRGFVTNCTTDEIHQRSQKTPRGACGTRFAVAQDAQRDDTGLTTTRNPGNVGYQRRYATITSGWKR
jgi:hypothetical protein